MSDEPAKVKSIERHRWVRKGKHWSLVTESVTPAKYVEGFKEQTGWRNGAKIKSVSSSSSILAKEPTP
jgi:hypothetical protein